MDEEKRNENKESALMGNGADRAAQMDGDEAQVNRPWRIFILSNTHWDREWYMPHEKYMVRLIGLFDRLLQILDDNPEYIFMTDGQYAVVSDYLEARPEKRPEIERFVRAGQLLVGPWYTQPLETLVTGEGMVRNLQYGIEASEALGGALRCGYMIDEFGHAAQTPQILQGFGIDSAIMWRGIPDESRSVLTWRSPDGTSVDLCYSNDGYGEATALPADEKEDVHVIDGQVIRKPGLVERVTQLLAFRGAHADTDCQMWLNGIDHSWAQPDLFDVMEKIRALFPDLEVRQTSPITYVTEVRKALEAQEIEKPVLSGELMNHDNVLESTHALYAPQKYAQAVTERTLVRQAEPSEAIGSLLTETDDAWALRRAWTCVLENHAHDSLGCCSVDEVYDEVMVRYARAGALSAQVTENALRALMARGPEQPALWFFNTTGTVFSGTAQFSFDLPEAMGGDRARFSLIAPDGSAVSCTVITRERVSDIRYQPRYGHPTYSYASRMTILADLPCVPAFGWLRLGFEFGEEKLREDETARMTTWVKKEYQSEHVPASAASFSNEYLAVKIEADGRITLTDRERGITYPGLFLFSDDGEANSCYVHKETAAEAAAFTSAGADAEIEKLYENTLGTSWRISFELEVPEDTTDGTRTARSKKMAKLGISVKLTLLSGSRRLDAEVTVRNTAKNHRLRLFFPTGLTSAVESRGGQPFDLTARPISRENAAEDSYPTHPMQDLCDVSDASHGLSVFSEGTFEYECIDDEVRTLALTLLRAVDVIDTSYFAKNPDFIMKKAQLQETMTFRLAVFPHGASLPALFDEADRFLLPPLCRVNRAPETSIMPDYAAPVRELPECAGLFSVSDSAVRITAVKNGREKDHLILRLWNAGNREAEFELTVSVPGKMLREVFKTRLSEDRISEVKISESQSGINKDAALPDGNTSEQNTPCGLTLRAGGIMTLELVFR